MEGLKGSPKPSSEPDRIRAAECVRMSTGHQECSRQNQQKLIRQCAHNQGMVIVKTYTDAAKSGLRIDD